MNVGCLSMYMYICSLWSWRAGRQPWRGRYPLLAPCRKKPEHRYERCMVPLSHACNWKCSTVTNIIHANSFEFLPIIVFFLYLFTGWRWKWTGMHIVNISTSIHSYKIKSPNWRFVYFQYTYLWIHALPCAGENQKTQWKNQDTSPRNHQTEKICNTLIWNLWYFIYHPKQHSTSESRLSTSDELDIPGDEVSYWY